MHLAVVAWIGSQFVRLFDTGNNKAVQSVRRSPRVVVSLIPQLPVKAATTALDFPANDTRHNESEPRPRVVASDTSGGRRIYHDLQLSRKPELLHSLPVAIDLQDSSEEGTAIFRLVITRAGTVASVTTIHSTLSNELEQQLIDQLREAIFRPGEFDGHPVNSETVYIFNIEPM